MDQISLASQESIDSICQTPRNLCSPLPVGGRMDSSYTNTTCPEIDCKEDQVSKQTKARPNFDCKEIGGRNHLPMEPEELTPSGLAAPFRGGFDPVFFQNVGDCASGHDVP